jgi:hypothetical protein
MQYKTYIPNPIVEQNTFIKAIPQDAPLPTFEQSRELLPQPHWAGHDDAIACYWKTWQIAFSNLRQPTKESGFIANFIDTAFNGCLFMWDSSFILMFARYGCRAFDFQRTLDNLYAKQHPDGFINREILETDGTDRCDRYDPTSTGPNIMPWSEWEHFRNFADRSRLAAVWPVLRAYHQWLRTYRTWPDGSYWTSGWGCGMDNQPRIPEALDRAHFRHRCFSHVHMSWIDACLQQLLSCRNLLDMATVLGKSAEMDDFRQELDQLGTYVQQHMWDDRTAFFYDRFADGGLSTVKTIGAYWALIAGAVPADKLEPFIAHLKDEREFNRPHRVPTLSADHPKYNPLGGYWCGSVWAPTNYMVIRGLSHVGQDDLAHEIAVNHVQNVVGVFNKTGTIWENYSPEAVERGDCSKPDFVGWSGLPPVAVLFEYVFGLRPQAQENRLVWDVRLTEAHGVKRYPFGRDGLLNLSCQARTSPTQRPVIEATSNIPLTLEIRWPGGSEKKTLNAER